MFHLKKNNIQAQGLVWFIGLGMKSQGITFLLLGYPDTRHPGITKNEMSLPIFERFGNRLYYYYSSLRNKLNIIRWL